ncbi:hypothetical protein [Erythrobacter rubeus]|uniref:Uncharacterized protein n=1 Tax=Erythrobacter rubeus TaxID=2760803 RepID=A0ABR8KRC7_9SPHN|nr:hypothetical protein [Erythrobacter rubeus]MBD2843265.1 hypothetical protein [Erythrobacter rubeus]
MAKSGASRGWGKKPVWITILGLVLLGLGIAGNTYRDEVTGYAEVGSSYAARVACSCRFVAGRSLEDCEKDKLGGMELVTLSDDAEAKSVTARFPLIASHTATYREGYGCVLEKWEG